MTVFAAPQNVTLIDYNHYTMRASIWFLSIALFGSALLAQRMPITLDALYAPERNPSASPGNPLAWSPDGERFVYRQGDELRIYNIPGLTSRSLTATQPMADAAKHADNEAPEPGARPDSRPNTWTNRRANGGAVEWSPAEGKILYTTGGDLFWIDVAKGEWIQLTKTAATEHDAKLSPDGRSVAFERDYDLYVLEIESRKERRLTSGGSAELRNGALDWVYPEELSLGTAYWWSPDAKSVAYLQFDVATEPLVPHSDLLGIRPVYEPQRYPQAGENNPRVRLGVVSSKGGKTKWMEVGDTVREFLIGRVAWTPDSEKLYVIRTTRLQDRLELLAYDADGGGPKVVLEESAPDWVNMQEAPQFLSDGAEFLWLSENQAPGTESEGFRHLYLFRADGSDKRALTQGPWEVTTVNGINKEGTKVFFTSSEVSPLERQLYVISLDNRDKRQLSKGAGTHSARMGPQAKYYLDTYSSVDSPPLTTLHIGNNRSRFGEQIGIYRPADRSVLEEYEILPTEFVRFDTAEGVPLDARLIRPANFDPARKYPAVVQVYGGPHAQSVRNAWAGLSMDQVLAHAGFVVWQVDNRGSAGRGHAFESPVNRHLGVVELQDQVKGVEYLISLGFVDPERIGITGWSYGGFMTLNALLNAPATFAAGVAGAPVTDWRNYDTIYTERYMGLPTADDNLSGYVETSMVEAAGNLEGDLLVLHNLEDDNVLIQNTVQLINALERADKIFDMTLYTQKTHGVTGPEAKHRDTEILEFFEEALQ